MKLKQIISIADAAYPDGLVAQAAKGEDVGDSLATFVAVEIAETYEPRRGDLVQLERAVGVIGQAMSDLQDVHTRLSHVLDNRQRMSRGVEPLYPEDEV